jgi:hypothetical protein
MGVEMTGDEQRMDILRRFVREQTFDEGLWGQCRYASEQYMQNALKLLHRVVKNVDIEPLKEVHWNE